MHDIRDQSEDVDRCQCQCQLIRGADVLFARQVLGDDADSHFLISPQSWDSLPISSSIYLNGLIYIALYHSAQKIWSYLPDQFSQYSETITLTFPPFMNRSLTSRIIFKGFLKSLQSPPISRHLSTATRALPTTDFGMTTAIFKHIDTSSYQGKPWSKVDGPGTSFKLVDHEREVVNIRGQQHKFTTDNSGFAVYEDPAKEKSFTDETAIRNEYYGEVEAMLRKRLPGVKKVSVWLF